MLKDFLLYADDDDRSNFITYGWSEAIQEGLKKEYPCGGEQLWTTIMNKYPGEFPIAYPPSAEVLAAVLKKFPTKQQLEEQWVRNTCPGFLNKVKEEASALVPTVLVRIIVEYARPTWTDIE